MTKEPKAKINVTWGGLMPLLIMAVEKGDKNGSAETILMDLAKWLDKEGVKVT